MIPDTLRNKPELLWARRLVWLYFWLLILEGALRKWALPALADPLLLVRDPLVLLIYFLAGTRRHFPMNGFILTSIILAVCLGAGALLWGHGNVLVMLYGLRTNFLHLPLIFVIPEIFSLDDVKDFGRAVLWISLPMSLLIILQFLSPPDSVLNVAVGGTAGQIKGALGRVCPAGTFSFVTGTTSFLAFQLVFIIACFIAGQYKVLRAVSLLCLIFALISSVSRSALLSCGLILGISLWGCFLNPKQIKRGAGFLALAAIFVAVASFTPLFQVVSTTMNPRIENADDKQSRTPGLLERFHNELSDPAQVIKTVSMTGAGTGAGTSVGARIFVGRRGFLLGENEWSRLLLESGLILGLFLIGLRITLAGYLVYWGYKTLKKSDNNPYPWVLCSAVVPLVLFGSWGQPTILGFACFGAGLVLAATRPSYEIHPLFKHAYSSARR